MNDPTFCKSYYDDNNILQDCTCGKCGKEMISVNGSLCSNPTTHVVGSLPCCEGLAISTCGKCGGKENPELKIIVAYCKVCRRPRAIIQGLCPGCMKRGTIVFDSEINILKEMSL